MPEYDFADNEFGTAKCTVIVYQHSTLYVNGRLLPRVAKTICVRPYKKVPCYRSEKGGTRSKSRIKNVGEKTNAEKPNLKKPKKKRSSVERSNSKRPNSNNSSPDIKLECLNFFP